MVCKQKDLYAARTLFKAVRAPSSALATLTIRWFPSLSTWIYLSPSIYPLLSGWGDLDRSMEVRLDESVTSSLVSLASPPPRYDDTELRLLPALSGVAVRSLFSLCPWSKKALASTPTYSI